MNWILYDQDCESVNQAEERIPFKNQSYHAKILFKSEYYPMFKYSMGISDHSVESLMKNWKNLVFPIYFFLYENFHDTNE